MTNNKIEDFLDYLYECEMSPNTIQSYKYSVKQFFSRYSEITKKNMIDFKKYLIENKTATTAGLRIVTMNKYCDWIGKPECKVKPVKGQKRFFVDNIPNDEEYQKVLDFTKTHNLKYYWMIRFLAGTGMRISELLSVTKKDLQNGYIEIHSKGKERRIIIPKSLSEESAEYFSQRKEEEYLFYSRLGNKMNERGVNSCFKYIAEQTGVKKELLHPHAFRHYFAKKMLKATNNDISLVSSYLGHSNIATTAIYTMSSRKEQEEQLNQNMTW